METEKYDINTDDLDLINGFKAGNRKCFNLLVLKHQKKVYSNVRKMVLNHDDTDEVTQEIFIKLYESLKDFRGDSKFSTYLYRISINYSLNHIKRNNAKQIKFSSTNDIDIPNPIEENIDMTLDSQKKTEYIEKAFSKLPIQQRAVFNMRFYEEMSYEEISKVLNTSIGGLKANYFHAIKKIGKYFSDNNLEYIINEK